MKTDWVLGLDIGGTHIRAGKFDSEYRLEDFRISSSPSLLGRGEDPIGALAAYIHAYCVDHSEAGLPRAISIGFPSTLNKEKTMLLSTPNLPGLNVLSVTEPLEKKLALPVFINRDVNLLLLNDLHVHHLEHAEIVIGCYFGTGLGNSIRINGSFLNGAHGVAGELGHIPLAGGSKRCGCGNIGCAETLSSGRRLTELQTQFFPEDELSQLFLKHADSPILKDYVEMLSLPVATEINLLDPNCVILGGGVLQTPGFPMDTLFSCIHAHTRKPLPCETLRLIVSQGTQESGVIGAGMYAFEQLEKLMESRSEFV